MDLEPKKAMQSKKQGILRGNFRNFMNIQEAVAFYSLGLLTGKQIVDLATQWLNSEEYTDTLFNLSNELPTMEYVVPVFMKYLKERNIQIPSEEKSMQVAIRYYLCLISEGKIDPFEGMSFMDNKLSHRKDKNKPKQKYVGEYFGLEHMYTWYRELQDAEDGSRLMYYTDLPKEEATRRFKEHLKEEAIKLLEDRYRI